MESTHERTLALAGGRALAYSTSGSASSTTVVLYLHGAFTIGEASLCPRAIASKYVHYVCPTLPGWGNTSPPTPSVPYIVCLINDMTSLLDHLYPENGRDIKLYLSGGSFGTVPAQILYGASYDKFPYGRCIAGVLLMAGLPPFRYHKGYAKYMDWGHYFLLGPISQWFPFKHVLPSLVTSAMARKVDSVENAEKFMRWFVFDKMDEAEKAEFAQWREGEGITDGEVVRRFAESAARSVAKSWEGFRLMTSVLHSDWGFRPDTLDEEHSRPFVMLVTTTRDTQAPPEWTQYLSASYKNSKVMTLHGGHIGVLYHMNDIWEEFLTDVE